MLKGIDVSHHNGQVDWPAVYKAGARFALIKATEGTSYVDGQLRTNLLAARQAGLYVGLYHYFQPGEQPVAQANHLLQTVQRITRLEPATRAFRNLLVPFLDLEEAGGLSRDRLVNSALSFIKRVRAVLGRGCVVYTYPAFITEHLAGAKNAQWLGGYPLWIASYTKSRQARGKPRIPAGVWPPDVWSFWQYTDHGTWPGVPGEGSVDLDVFWGGVQEIEGLVCP